METRRVQRLGRAAVVVAALLVVAAVAFPISATMRGANFIDVELEEYVIRMPEEIPAGETVFMVRNVGSELHNLRIEGQGIDVSLPTDLEPGESGRLEVDLEPGTYEVTCPVLNHAALGMRLELTVTEEMQIGPTATVTVTGTPARVPTATPMEPAATPSLGRTPVAPGPTPPGLPETGQVPWTVATPGGMLPGEPAIALEEVVSGLIDPVNVVAPPDGTDRLFVVERPGRIRIVENGELLDEPFLDLVGSTLSAFLEQGLYDIEFHPDYATNGRFFVHFAELLRNGDSLIVEYTVSDDDPNVADPESARVIMHIEQPWANHNGGELAFGPDGYLYIGSGDGGWEGDPLEAGQDLRTLLGKLLRIDVDNEDGRPYAIPPTNPFTATVQLVELFGIPEQEFANIHVNARPEIWAYGLRNPWKFQFDPETGDLWLPDVGQNVWEEINYQPNGSGAGANYGWDWNMGTHCFPIEREECPLVGVPPVAEYSHDLGSTVIGIGVYRGTEIPDLDGVYLVGDYGSGRIWGIAEVEEGEWVMQELADTEVMITGSGQAEDGTLYITSCNCVYNGPDPFANPPGSLWRIVAADEPEG
jgi:glucose/arabinose dehydrogenase/plastocyanin